jgi:hypothetical protein
MALIKCNECGKEISNKADKCVHCGYPINFQNKVDEIEKDDNIQKNNMSKDILEKNKLIAEYQKIEKALKKISNIEIIYFLLGSLIFIFSVTLSMIYTPVFLIILIISIICFVFGYKRMKLYDMINKEFKNMKEKNSNIHFDFSIESYAEKNNFNNKDSKLSRRDLIVSLSLIIIVFGPMIWWLISSSSNSYIGAGSDAIYCAKRELGDGVLENEIKFKIYSSKNDKYIVECNTTNSDLKSEYGSKFYFGYYRDITGKTEHYYASENLQTVKEAIDYDK